MNITVNSNNSADPSTTNTTNPPLPTIELPKPMYLDTVQKNLCLNMIVKNESRVIRRMLESVVKYIDCYCICDTGSTDNTIEVIQNFFHSQNPPIPGKIIQEPFRDFGYNRSFALKACEELDVKYVLLMDADMILKVGSYVSKEQLHQSLTADVYHVFQGSDLFYYKNVRIVRNRMGASYWGVTHEYVKTPEGCSVHLMDKGYFFINDIGDGGCKTDKYVRDIQLLKKGLEEFPGNDRYTFYLANSYRDAGQYENAIETYKNRIAIGGWFDEVWHSYYSIGKCYQMLGDMVNAVHWWMEGYHFYPNRIENLFQIVQYYRLTGRNNLAYAFYVLADHERNKQTHHDYLFLEKEVYDYKLDYELSIFGYYCNIHNYDLAAISMKILKFPHTENSIARNVVSNYKFYVEDISKYNILDDSLNQTLKSIGNSIPEIQEAFNHDFVSSTPSLCFSDHGKLIVNLRYVDYKINDYGGYENKGQISTKNVIAILKLQYDLMNGNRECWEIEREFLLNYNTEHDGLYVGLEDVRLFSMENNDELFFNANRGLAEHKMVVEHGAIQLSKEQTLSGFISIEKQRSIEKNWVLFENSQHQQKIIYGWHPLVIGDIAFEAHIVSTKKLPNMQFMKTNDISTPRFFKDLRGSSNGVLMADENEVWFLCHAVSYEERRFYYHIFVVLDATTYQVKKYTPYFTFDREKVEYSLGFVYFEEQDELLIGYSVMDRETKYMRIKKQILEDKMIQN